MRFTCRRLHGFVPQKGTCAKLLASISKNARAPNVHAFWFWHKLLTINRQTVFEPSRAQPVCGWTCSAHRLLQMLIRARWTMLILIMLAASGCESRRIVRSDRMRTLTSSEMDQVGAGSGVARNQVM